MWSDMVPHFFVIIFSYRTHMNDESQTLYSVSTLACPAIALVSTV